MYGDSVGKSKQTWESLDDLYEALPEDRREAFIELLRSIIVSPSTSTVVETTFRWVRVRRH
jgi:hypothetical protein